MATNLERLFRESEWFRQAASSFAFADCDECPTDPTQMADWLMAEHVDAQRDNNGTCPNGDETASNGGDNREKLEADVRQYANQSGDIGTLGACWEKRMLEFLDRQAAITASEYCYAEDQLREELDRVRAERDEWKTKCETREVAYKQADAERKRYSEQIDELFAERDEWKAKAEQAERAMNSAAGKWAKADEENRGLRKMLVLDDGTVEDYTERVDPLTALAHQKQLAEEWRDRCHNAEALCDKLEAERDALQVEYERAVHDAQTLYVKTEAERDEWRAKYLGAMDDVEDYKTLWHSSCDERDEWIARVKAEKANSDGHWRNANRIAKECDALARDLAECEREREKWRAKVSAMLDAADAIRSLA